MTASQQTFTSRSLRGRGAGLALAAAFGVGLASGLAAPRLLSHAPSLTTGGSLPLAPTVARPASPHAGGAGSVLESETAVNPYTGFMTGPLRNGRYVNSETGFVTGPLVVSPVVNRLTGFVVGAELSQAAPAGDPSSPAVTAH